VTFALEFDTDDETQRVIRVALLRLATHSEDRACAGDERAAGLAQACLRFLSREGPWHFVDESGIGLVLAALRHEIEHGLPENAAKAQEIRSKIDERFGDLFKNLPLGMIL
jgi:hypothetical protein